MLQSFHFSVFIFIPSLLTEQDIIDIFFNGIPCKSIYFIVLVVVDTGCRFDLFSADIHLFQDIMPLDVYHLGGDEVPVLALNDSPICQRFMVQYPYYNSTTRLREYFVHRLVEIAKKLQVKVQAWEDGLLDSMKFPFRMTDLKVPQLSVNLWNNIWENGRGHRTAIFANSNYKVCKH